MDEMYTLYIGKIQRTTLLFANTVWGGLRSLETVSQLVYPVLYQGKQFFALNGTFILDFPRFSYRGVMIDTSRHYIPVPVLKQNLDAMSYNKFNVFHWHLVDDQAFPYESTVFPELHQEGSYDSETHVYSTQDVQDIIEYSRIRGIRVIPEFDIPGHTLSWGKSQKNLLTKCFDSKTNTPDGTFGPIDPTKEENYDFLFRFFKEVKSVFPDEYLHLGGDEVDPACWKSSPVINQFMKDRQIKSYEELESFFIQKMYGKLQSLDKSYLFWQEVFDNQDKLDQETSVINVWKWYGERNWPEELQKVTTAGFRAVLSAPWYLNYIHYGPDWTTYYESDPHGFNGTERQKELILGGSACMWTEYVDGSGIMPRTWPRASAVAERLWSDANVKDTRRALPRIRRMQCLMQKRGLRVEPINGPSFCPCDHTYY
jgi:hexosaminidase